MALTDHRCRHHLNVEHEALRRKLAGIVARNRPSPLSTGKPATPARGIARTIGWVNYLGDTGRLPRLKMTAIDKAFGVAESTGQGKSKLIREILKIRSFDPEYHRGWRLTAGLSPGRPDPRGNSF